MLELTDRSDVCTCADTLRFLNADEHNTAIKHAIQEDLRQAHVTNLHTEETRAKVQAREQENLSLQAEIDCLLREAAAVHARCESCDTEINTLRPMIVEQVDPPPFASYSCVLTRFLGREHRNEIKRGCGLEQEETSLPGAGITDCAHLLLLFAC